MRITNLYINETYEGVLEGIPSRKSGLVKAQRWIKRNWGERAMTVLGNYDFSFSGKEDIYCTFGTKEECLPRLPKFTYIAWVNFDTDDYKKGDGKHLMVIWFSENPPGSSLDFDKLFEGRNLFEEAEYFEY